MCDNIISSNQNLSRALLRHFSPSYITLPHLILGTNIPVNIAQLKKLFEKAAPAQVVYEEVQPFQLLEYQWREDKFDKQTASARPLQFMIETTSNVQAANTIAL